MKDAKQIIKNLWDSYTDELADERFPMWGSDLGDPELETDTRHDIVWWVTGSLNIPDVGDNHEIFFERIGNTLTEIMTEIASVHEHQSGNALPDHLFPGWVTRLEASAFPF